jgi:Tol biopolymer transport system component
MDEHFCKEEIMATVKTILAIIVIFVLASCGTSAPAVTAEPTQMATLAPTRVPSPAFTPTLTPTQVPVVLYSDDFENKQSGWRQLTDAVGSTQYSGGQYVMSLPKGDTLSWSCANRSFTDAVLTVDAMLVSGNPNLTGPAVFWRFIDNRNYYVLRLYGNGKWHIDKLVNGEWKYIYDWTLSSTFNTEQQIIKIAITFDGGTTAIYINDKYMTSFQDSSIAAGDICLGDSSNASSAVEVSFDNLVMYTINSWTPPMATLTHTQIPSPTFTSTLAATIAPHTTTNGPYLVFLRDRGNGLELVLMDADGKGEVAFPFPMNRYDPNITPESLSELVSPDGSWLAFYTGYAGVYGQVGTNNADLTLNLMSLGVTSPAGSTKVVSRLLSADYPANFVQAAQELGSEFIDAQSLQFTFEFGITRSIAWSPDGQYLAFAGQMDGLSSDLYLYNSVDGTIQQLSSGPEEVMWIAWSPDGKWILDASTTFVGEGWSNNIYATSLDGQVVHHLFEKSGLLDASDLTWINTHELLAYQSQNGLGDFGLARVDVESGNVDKIWDGSFATLAVDPTGKWLAFQAVQEVQAAETGLFLVNLATLESTKVQVSESTKVQVSESTPGYWILQGILSMSSGPERAFLTRYDALQNTDRGLYYLSKSGVLTSDGISADRFSVAPNQADWIAIKDDIQLFAAGSSQARIFNLPAGMKSDDIRLIVWRPDSSGIFLESNDHQLYALDFSSGISTLVEPSLYTGSPAGLIWVRK